MTDATDDAFQALRLPATSLQPRVEMSEDLRARVHRRLGFELPRGHVVMPKAAGL